MKMKWIKFNYNNMNFVDGKKYFLFVHRIDLNKCYYSLVCGRNKTIYMIEYDSPFDFDSSRHKILYYVELTEEATFFQELKDLRKNKISKLLV